MPDSHLIKLKVPVPHSTRAIPFNPCFIRSKEIIICIFVQYATLVYTFWDTSQLHLEILSSQNENIKYEYCSLIYYCLVCNFIWIQIKSKLNPNKIQIKFKFTFKYSKLMFWKNKYIDCMVRHTLIFCLPFNATLTLAGF